MHRFMEPKEQLRIAESIIDNHGNENFAVSVGVKSSDREMLLAFYKTGIRMVCVDVAHGDSELCVDMVSWIRATKPDMFIIAGNVATGEGAKRLWLAGADAVKVGVGPGCFAAGTRILMANGTYENIEDVKIGSYVINMHGKAVKVANAFCTGIRKVARLRNNVFYEDTYVLSNHNFWVGDLNSVSEKTLANSGYRKHLDNQSKTSPKTSKYKWKKIGDIRQDVLLMPKTIDFVMPETFRVILQKRTTGNWKTGYAYEDDSVIVPSYSSGYLFGTFIGDGHAMCAEHNGSHIGAVTWYFGEEEGNIATKLATCIKDIFGKEPKIEVTDNTINVVFYYKPLADYLFSFGKKIEKHLPSNLLVSNNEYLQGLYDGLIDSDGHCSENGRLGFTNTSIKAIELFNVVNYLVTGSFPNSEKKKISVGSLTNCNIENCHQPYRFRPLKKAEWRHTQNYQVVKILGYEETSSEVLVYDLTVDCDTHSFIANNTIVHNSLCTTRIETGNGVPQLTALMNVFVAKTQLTTPQYEYQNVATPPMIDKPIYIIADGGIKAAGDIVKALCFADMVMIGNLFAGCEETPGEKMIMDGMTYKKYVGSSTHKANHIEGIAALVPYSGSYRQVITKLMEGLRSGCSYQGAHTLKELQEDPIFVKITNAGLKESHPHDVVIT